MMKTETYPTGAGDLKVTLLGHASILFEYVGKVIYIDPYAQVTDFSALPKADLIILTHDHSDHLDTVAIDLVKTPDTEFIMPKACRDILKYGEVIKYGEIMRPYGFSLKAVPAYNVLNKRPTGEVYHPKGRGNGYVFLFGKLKVYVAGDTEIIPEMAKIGLVEIAFLPKNLPFTMNDAMFLKAVEMVKPKYLYPYHYFDFKEEKLIPRIEKLGVKVVLPKNGE